MFLKNFLLIIQVKLRSLDESIDEVFINILINNTSKT